MILVSSKYLPFMEIDLSTVLFNGGLHEMQVCWGNFTCKAEELMTGSSLAGLCFQGLGEVEDLLLQVVGHEVEVFDNLVNDGWIHIFLSPGVLS